MNRKRKADPEAVLAGRVQATAHELFDLIHRVNPTGGALPGSETARRYALKSRLQSLLVRRFPDALRVVRDAGGDDVVSLLDRAGGRDACHAIVAQLEPDARAWVQRRLDEGPEPEIQARSAPSPAATAAAADAPASLLQRAQAALASYDYEAARELAEAALRASPRDRGAGVLLLELLVDHLGLDQDALRPRA